MIDSDIGRSMTRWIRPSRVDQDIAQREVTYAQVVAEDVLVSYEREVIVRRRKVALELAALRLILGQSLTTGNEQFRLYQALVLRSDLPDSDQPTEGLSFNRLILSRFHRAEHMLFRSNMSKLLIVADTIMIDMGHDPFPPYPLIPC